VRRYTRLIRTPAGRVELTFAERVWKKEGVVGGEGGGEEGRGGRGGGTSSPPKIIYAPNLVDLHGDAMGGHARVSSDA